MRQYPIGKGGVTSAFGDFELDPFVKVPCVGAGIRVGVITGIAIETVFLKVGFSPFVLSPTLRAFLSPRAFPGTSSLFLWRGMRDDGGR